MGLGACHYPRTAQSGIPEGNHSQDMEGAGGCRELCPVDVPAVEGCPLSRSARGIGVFPCRGHSRHVSRPAAQAARDGDPAGASGHLLPLDWLAIEGWLSTRDARRRLRRLGHRHPRADRQRYPWTQRRHLGLELCNQRSEEHTSELQSRGHLVCRLLLEKKNKKKQK